MKNQLMPLAFLLIALPGCSGSNGTPHDTTLNPDASIEIRGDAPLDLAVEDSFEDIEGRFDQTSNFDLPPPLDLVTVDAEPGTLELGATCSDDAQCQSGLCLRLSTMAGCTVPCQSMADCSPYGLLCEPLRPGLSACVPPPPGANETCTSNIDCPYPLYCQPLQGGCTLPECTFDADCSDTEQCQQMARRCQPLTCSSTVQCEHPVETCNDGQCGPPECTETSQCPEGQFCHPTQLICDDALPCNEEGECSYYNQVCVDALCIPNLCAAGCTTPGTQCDPATGECGLPCTHNEDCATAMACSSSSGTCYENTPPLAWATLNGNVVGEGKAGESVLIDCTASVDPEGEGLSWRWRVTQVPPESNLLAPTLLATADDTLTFVPDVPGQFFIGCSVQDSGGAMSMESQVALWVLP